MCRPLSEYSSLRICTDNSSNFEEIIAAADGRLGIT